VVGKPGKLPKDVEDITIDVVLFDTAVGTAEMVKVEPLKAKEPIRLNIGTAAASGYVTNVRDSKVEVKLKKPVCLMPKSRVAISRRIAERWRLIGSGIAA
jgi:translation initiation factor 2 subunit 3